MSRTILRTISSVHTKEVAYVSTFPPKRCGIATFTSDLVNSISQLKTLRAQRIISIQDNQLFRTTNEETEFGINRDAIDDYELMADILNHSSVNVVNIHHEFGIFGGESGEYICTFLDNLKKPVATTLHTVLPNFESKIKDVFSRIVEKSTAIVVLNKTTRELVKKYGVASKKIKLIPHGCPDLPLVNSDEIKLTLGLKNKFTLSTFGLLSKGKGIENVIQALPEIIRKEPRTIYNVIGVTHPNVKRSEGENYRKSLLEMAKNLGVSEHVKFINHFLSKNELYNYLQATDVYITPYLSPNQVSSGTLSYALAAGKAVVSTPYLHAKEALNENRGLLCRFNDSTSIAEKVMEILEDQSLRKTLEQNAYNYSRKFTWPIIAKKYLSLFDHLTKQEDKERQLSDYNYIV